MDDEPRGVKGWLLTFVIIMAVISPIYGIYQVYRALYNDPMIATAYGELFPTLEMFTWGVVVAATLIGWFVAWRLLTIENWTSVRIAIAGIWLVSVGGNIAQVVGISVITGAPIGFLIGEMGPALMIRPFVFGLVWTAYLLKSQRVENTYRGGEEQAEVFE